MGTLPRMRTTPFFRLLSVSLVLPLAAIACSKDQPGTAGSETPQDLSDPEVVVELGATFEGDGYTIQPPEGWTVDDSGAQADVIFTDPGDGNRSNINVRGDASGGVAFDQVLATARTQLEEAFPGYTFVADEEITVNGYAGHLLEAQLTSEGTAYHNLQYLIPDGDIVYSVTATTIEESWAEQETTFRASMDTFRLA